MESKTVVIQGDIRYSGVLVAKDASITLRKSEKHPDKYDIYRSIRALSILDGYPITRIVFTYEQSEAASTRDRRWERSRHHNQRTPFTKDSGANLLTAGEAEYLVEKKMHKLTFNASGNANISDEERERCASYEKRGWPCKPKIFTPTLKCVMCTGEALLADTSLDMMFCSATCREALI
jgi:hypothetical protein